MLRTGLSLSVVLSLTACPSPRPAEPATAPPASPLVDAPAPLPPEETPPPESLPRLDPPDAKPVEPGITATGAPTRGKLPKTVIDEKLKEVQPAIVACYERGLKAKPELRGNVAVDFVVSTEGKVVHAEDVADDDALRDEGVVRCIVSEIEKLVFPPPTGGRVFIHYPLRLESPKP